MFLNSKIALDYENVAVTNSTEQSPVILTGLTEHNKYHDIIMALEIQVLVWVRRV